MSFSFRSSYWVQLFSHLKEHWKLFTVKAHWYQVKLARWCFEDQHFYGRLRTHNSLLLIAVKAANAVVWVLYFQGGHVTGNILNKIINLSFWFDNFLISCFIGNNLTSTNATTSSMLHKKKIKSVWAFKWKTLPTYTTGLWWVETSWREPNKYFLELLFTFPNLVVFLTCAIMWWTGSSLLAPLVSRQPSVPTHWQALDLESTVVIVIYASSDDRCAHIVLSIQAETAQGHCAVSIQSLHLPQKVKLSSRIPIDSVRS